MNRTILVALTVLSIGCGPTVRMEVLQPADVFVPTHIQTLAYVDRSKAKNLGQGALGVLEGVLTGEAPGADREGRQAAGQGARDVLNSSPRFNVVLPSDSGVELEESLFDKELSWKAATKICNKTNSQGILALEAFDSDSTVEQGTETVTEYDGDQEVDRLVHTAQRDTSVLTAWRLYDVENKRIVDELRDHGHANTWTSRGDTPDAALANLEGQIPTVRQLGRESGESYAARIAPTYITVSRKLYSMGHPDLKAAAKMARGKNWKGARKVWRGLADNAEEAKIRDRAAYNLAVVNEVDGNLKKALEWAHKATESGGTYRMRNYINILQQRQRDAERLKRQMAEAGETP